MPVACPATAGAGTGAWPGAFDSRGALFAQIMAARRPFSVQWELTHACNLRCVMCYNQSEERPELSTRESLAVLEQLARAGGLCLLLTGGEPLVRPDFFVVAEHARSLGFAVDIKTNGTLITLQTADRLAALHPGRVEVSLPGATYLTAGAVTRTAGSLARTLDGISLLKERGIQVRINILLLAINAAECQQMIDLGSALDVECAVTFKLLPAGNGSGTHHRLPLQQATAVMQAETPVFGGPEPEPGARPCGAGLASCLISPSGLVYPCVPLRIVAGDLRCKTFSEIWAHGAILEELRARNFYSNLSACAACALLSFCRGRCAGEAWQNGGDLYGRDPAACFAAEARYRAWIADTTLMQP